MHFVVLGVVGGATLVFLGDNDACEMDGDFLFAVIDLDFATAFPMIANKGSHPSFNFSILPTYNLDIISLFQHGGRERGERRKKRIKGKK